MQNKRGTAQGSTQEAKAGKKFGEKATGWGERRFIKIAIGIAVAPIALVLLSWVALWTTAAALLNYLTKFRCVRFLQAFILFGVGFLQAAFGIAACDLPPLLGGV